MARIVIRTSLANKNYTVQDKIIDSPLGEPINVRNFSLLKYFINYELFI